MKIHYRIGAMSAHSISEAVAKCDASTVIRADGEDDRSLVELAEVGDLFFCDLYVDENHRVVVTVVDQVGLRDGVFCALYGSAMITFGPQSFFATGLAVYMKTVEKHRSQPAEIDAERWSYLLEVLPPIRWVRGADDESFRLVEFTAADLTLAVVRIEDRYFEFTDQVGLSHDELIRIVRDSAAWNRSA